MLKYPNDRCNGYVQLKDGNGNVYMPDMNRRFYSEAQDAMKYAGAFLILARRYQNAKSDD